LSPGRAALQIRVRNAYNVLTIIEDDDMDIFPCGGRPSRKAPASYFTGTVWQDPVIETPAPAQVRALRVAFEPGARTAWHTHPLGQTLYILSGSGLVQCQGGPVREVRAGDTVFFAPNEKHWHGAGPQTSMVHLAIAEALDGKHVEWMEHVTDEQYAKPPGA
jgi:quercetin dioxygenase-like cupin family protein